MKEKKNQIIEELRKIGPGLIDLKSKEHFSVPHNYFRQLPDRVFEQIVVEESKPSLIVRFNQYIDATIELLRKPQYTVAFATILLFVVAAIVLIKPTGDVVLLSDITTADALEYVMANIDDYDPSEIYALVAPVDLLTGVLPDLSAEELGQTIDDLLRTLDTESLEELF